MSEYDYTEKVDPEQARALDREAMQREREDELRLDDPKPAKRYRAPHSEWSEIRAAFSGDVCRVCGGPWESLHHIYPRGQGGDDVVVNLGPVCGSGTTGCHGRLEARDSEARAAFRASLTDANRWYLTWKLGLGAAAWLDRNYAELRAEAA